MKAVGARLPRYDGIGHVTGQTRYVDDVRVPGTLWTKALRSPIHRGDITRLDTSRAEAYPGVHAVVTHVDVPKNVYGHLEALGIPADEPLLAENEVRWRGQVIAVLAADDEATALEAVDLIEVEFEEKEPLFDIRKAFDPDARRSTIGATGTTTSRARWTAARFARATSRRRSTRRTSSSRACTVRPRSSTVHSRRSR